MGARGEKGKEGGGTGGSCIWARGEGMVSCMIHPSQGLSRGMGRLQGGGGHISPLKGALVLSWALSNQCSARAHAVLTRGVGASL